MKNATKKPKIYKGEFQLLEEAQKALEDNSLSKDNFLERFEKFVGEYDKLLRQAVKITLVGDVNQRKLEKQRVLLNEKSEKLKEMANIRSRFFTNISHEFRTPLTLIIGPLEQMLSNCNDTALQQRYVLMLRNAQRLLWLIDQLLDLSRFESGRMKLQAGRRNIVPFLKDIVASFAALADKNELQLSFNPEKEGITLYFDPEKIEEAICNLLINAVKFTPAGGLVDVIVREQTGGKTLIIVRDTGTGIPQDRLTQVFEQFYQLDPKCAPYKKGFGIGLALAKQQIELHHGEIMVRSHEGEGTEFHITLPMGKEHLKADELISAPALPLEGQALRDHLSSDYGYMLEMNKTNGKGDETPEKTDAKGKSKKDKDKDKDIVLVVEDNSDAREYIKESLAPYYKVVEEGNGQKGIETAKKIIPDIVISDVMIPGVDGYDLCRELRGDINTCHIPIILLTSMASEEYVLKGLEAGADDYITKPFSPKILFARIKNLIDLRRQLQQTRQRKMTMHPTQISVSQLDEEFLKDLKKAINKNLPDSDFNVDQLAKYMYMSRTSLYRKVQALCGESPTDFIRSCRLKRAAQLLKENYGSILDVALEVGFASAAYFTKCFKDMYHQLPSTYRHS